MISNVSLSNNLYKQHKTSKAKVAFAGKTSFIHGFKDGLKTGKVAKSDLLAFLLSAVSGACYVVGGVGLLNDFAYEKIHKKQLSHQPENPFGFGANKTSNTLLQPVYDKKIFALFLNKKNAISFGHDGTSKKKNEGAQTIVPQTPFAKVGMKFARVGVAIAGVAGVFTGIALNLPLWAVGEGITSLSAPIIETPVGTGIFGLGLAAINLARVLDNDPKFKLDVNEFKAGGAGKKVKMLADNIGMTCKELGKSGKTIFGNVAKLLYKPIEGFSFFKNKMFSTRPASIVIQESLNDKGKVLLNTIPVNNPYLMHFAALSLCVSSIGLMIANKIKAYKAEKAALRGYGVSNGIDNVALAKWGVEKINIAKAEATRLDKVSGKTTGVGYALAGASLLSGQAGIDKNWGRGLMWTGVGTILLSLSVETGVKVYKSVLKKAVDPVMVRQWRIKLKDKAFSKELFGKIIDAFAEKFPEAKKGFKADSNKMQKELNKIFKDLSQTKEGKDLKEVSIEKISKDKNADEVLTSMKETGKKWFGSSDK